ncbi:MAG: imidazolonepropionase [Anaerolineales bacterium]|nr:imidazolonepropionase [Chloroflexota bacterium]MBL6981467.1 imidazolonepropionase [Anaerolineales bacterium]
MLIHSAAQLLTIVGTPQRGHALGDLGVIENGALLIEDGLITAVGPSNEMRAIYAEEEMIDASGSVVMPGLVDPHTHVVWAGDRAAEFEMRIQGKTYMEIMQAGGGIVSTVRKTRQATVDDLIFETRPRLRRMFANGTTTAEAKSGYGLDTESEIKTLDAILALDMEGPMELVPTFLGAHAIPPEFKDNTQGYTDLVCEEMLPAVKKWAVGKEQKMILPFVDVFCETGAFTLEQSRQILKTARELGFPLKIHADEFDNLGGVTLAAELGAASADHLVVTSKEDIAAIGASDTVAVSLPCTPFGLAEGEYTPAKDFLDANCILAIATDINPGTAWCESMQFAITLACRYLRLTPAQAIVAATLNAAAAINQADKIGSLEPGKQADLLILNVPDYRHLGYRIGGNLVKTVIKKGQIYPN